MQVGIQIWKLAYSITWLEMSSMSINFEFSILVQLTYQTQSYCAENCSWGKLDVSLVTQKSVWSWWIVGATNLFEVPFNLAQLSDLHSKVGIPNCHFLLLCLVSIIMCLVSIIRMVEFSYFIVGKWKGSTTPKNATFWYRMQKLWRVQVRLEVERVWNHFFHIRAYCHLGDVFGVMMTV